VLAVLSSLAFASTAQGATRLVAVFESAGNLTAGDPVRIAGVPVGTVDAVQLDSSGRTAQVTMTVSDAVPIHSDARADARWKNLLGGPLYIDLDPGSEGRPTSGTLTIPESRTSTQVTLEEILQPFDGRTAPAMRAVVRGLDRGFQDSEAVRSDLRVLDPALTHIERGFRALRGQERGDLQRLVSNSSQTVSQLAANHSDLSGLVSSAAQTLSVTSGRSADIDASLGAAPAALMNTQTTLTRLDQTLDKLDPLAEDLRIGVRGLRPALAAVDRPLHELPGVLSDAEPLVRSLRPALASLEHASRTGSPLLADLKPTVTRAERKLLPMLYEKDPDTGLRMIDMVGPTFAAVDAGGSEFDAEGHMLHFAPTGGENTLIDVPCGTFITDPTEEEKVRCQALEDALGKVFGAGE
jgi:phospholipid/cholesterol/gamma-HCH transport system substrate-binding protein